MATIKSLNNDTPPWLKFDVLINWPNQNFSTYLDTNEFMNLCNLNWYQTNDTAMTGEITLELAKNGFSRQNGNTAKKCTVNFETFK